MKLRSSIVLASTLWVTTLPEVLGQPPVAATEPLVVLGERLFFDSTLSADGTVSCATCHRPDLAFTDARARSVGVWKREGTRNAPSLIGVGQTTSLNWDGRASSLEEQVLDPFVTPTEHGLESHDDLLTRVSSSADYRQLLSAAFEASRWPPTTAELASALAAYIRNLDSDQPQAALEQAGTRSATAATGGESTPAARGRALFFGAAGCGACHLMDASGNPGSDNDFHAIGVGLAPMSAELGTAIEGIEKVTRGALNTLVLGDLATSQLGRYVVTRKFEDIGSFRTPSLRNVAVTAPYFHDGSVSTLEAAVEREVYYRREPRAAPLALGHEDRHDLVVYLRSLVGSRSVFGRE